MAGCDPPKLCAKLTAPPSWRAWFWNPAPPMGTPPPNAQPILLFPVPACATGQQPSIHQICRPLGNKNRGWEAVQVRSYQAFHSATGSTPTCLVAGAVAGRRSRLASLVSFAVPHLSSQHQVSQSPHLHSVSRWRIMCTSKCSKTPPPPRVQSPSPLPFRALPWVVGTPMHRELSDMARLAQGMPGRGSPYDTSQVAGLASVGWCIAWARCPGQSEPLPPPPSPHPLAPFPQDPSFHMRKSQSPWTFVGADYACRWDPWSRG